MHRRIQQGEDEKCGLDSPAMLGGQDLGTGPVFHMLQLYAKGRAFLGGCFKLVSVTVTHVFVVATSLGFKGVSTENDWHFGAFQLTRTALM